MRRIHQGLAAATILCAAAAAFGGDRAPPAEVLEWVRSHAVTVGEANTDPSAEEAAAIGQFIGAARVVAFGESTHAAHQPLIYRNRMIRFLIEHHGFTAITLESGFAQGRRVDAYIHGGDGDPVLIARQFLSWTFGEFESNVALIRWLRDYNANPMHRPVNFYGVDVSGGDSKDSLSFAGLALQDVISYLQATLPLRSRTLRTRLSTFTHRFTPETYAKLSTTDRAALDGALQSAKRLFTASRKDLIRASSPQAYEWASQGLLDCRRLEAIFRVWPQVPTDMNAWLQVSAIRDRTMADHLLWALSNEGPNGRIFTFAHAGHVAATPIMSDAAFRGLVMTPQMGAHLRAALGTDYRILITAASTNAADAPSHDGEIGTVDQTRVSVVNRQFLLDIRPTDQHGWWGQKQTINTDFKSSRDFIPNTATDGILFLDRLSCEPTTRAVANECHRGPT